ncbi:MAG: hypothetical protein OER43_18530 [Gammaproteobacteria bacterium]|nr:hypothetical protein [Gammaproteobacteria bacterium]
MAHPAARRRLGDAIAVRRLPLAEQSKHVSAGLARKSYMPLVSDEVKALLRTAAKNFANALQSDAEWWATRHAAFSAKFEQWFAQGRTRPGWILALKTPSGSPALMRRRSRGRLKALSVSRRR